MMWVCYHTRYVCDVLARSRLLAREQQQSVRPEHGEAPSGLACHTARPPSPSASQGPIGMRAITLPLHYIPTYLHYLLNTTPPMGLDAPWPSIKPPCKPRCCTLYAVTR
ncbi:hypothetical protein LZ30DRAFT_736505 [Colletotrichum cereale]|nr:hypothetical protein LZ30DRAFT_736505 [Colletotrichum cereale]